jgi:hypothetical protein
MHAGSVTLLTNAGAGNGLDVYWPGGHTSFVGESTFGGGSVKLQIKLPQDTYFDVATASLSAAGYVNVFLPPGTYRAVATTATANYYRLVRIPY